MSDVRVYVPTTFGRLREAFAGGGFPDGVPARTVADVLAAEPGLDEEEAEYAAMRLAADDALAALGPGELPARVVVAADVPASRLAAGPDGSTVRGGVPVRCWASVHLDTADARGDVAALLHAGGGSGQEQLERLEEHELAWFAVQEIPHLLETQT